MNKALGLVEVKGLSTAIFVADAMVKTSNVEVTEPENTRGLGWVTIKVIGDVGAVNAAVASGKQVAIDSGHYISSKVIPRPANSLDGVFGKVDFYSECNTYGRKKVESKRSSTNKSSKKSRKEKKKAEKKPKSIKTSSPEQLAISEKKPKDINKTSSNKTIKSEQKAKDINKTSSDKAIKPEQIVEDVKLDVKEKNEIPKEKSI